MIMTNEDEKGRIPPHEAMGETGVAAPPPPSTSAEISEEDPERSALLESEAAQKLNSGKSDENLVGFI
ncbi:hypothetical protein WR25_18773 [Diploscapter pachys]|uniref:Uncharacterized protein n=1 Tax=Diploscapter pachys TaxID=2018661 RepID=A0A2A2JQJ6_9BILA|nr:hypothetical protein WR25_18773 [Diploscapter pachys]